MREGLAYLPLKTTIEWLASLALLIASAPVFALVAAVVVLTSRGPVFYSQIRLGRQGRPFRIYKFRTMTADCEARTGPVWSQAGDPRLTTVGRWLRATHVDELPQLWNVLRGEMSLIGPRPERPEIAEKIERLLPAFRQRLEVRPGLTGLAQVLLPPDADINTVRFKLAHDLVYLRKIGFWLDFRISVSTILLLSGLRMSISSRFVRPFAAEQPPVDAMPMLRLTSHDFRIPPASMSGGTGELSKAA